MATNNTPPGSVVPPLTPPPTAEKPLFKSTLNMVNCFRLHRVGYRPGPWWEGRLRLSDYTQVLHVLDADRHLQKYVNDKLRYVLHGFATWNDICLDALTKDTTTIPVALA